MRETAIPSVTIEQAISDTHSHQERKRALPSHLVICLIIAVKLLVKSVETLVLCSGKLMNSWIAMIMMCSLKLVE
ncbi:transposase domain-containing protein [Iningainema tapete]|uniref:transposase domain-containing protein n=1 Tax=Iningainema tapete TaxID=2806730 RepID=UPI001EE19EEC|nr:transposase domain-containing protein [Iningainema tapete]